MPPRNELLPESAPLDRSGMAAALGQPRRCLGVGQPLLYVPRRPTTGDGRRWPLVDGASSGRSRRGRDPRARSATSRAPTAGRGEPRSLLPLPLGSRSRSRVAPGRFASDGWRATDKTQSVRVLLGFGFSAALCGLACGAASARRLGRSATTGPQLAPAGRNNTIRRVGGSLGQPSKP